MFVGSVLTLFVGSCHWHSRTLCWKELFVAEVFQYTFVTFHFVTNVRDHPKPDAINEFCNRRSAFPMEVALEGGLVVGELR